MPRLVDAGLSAIRAAADPDPQDILRAIEVGCTDSEVAGLMGLTEPELQRLIDGDPHLRSRFASLRAHRRFELRRKVHDIAIDDEHHAQGRLLREILVGELQVDSGASEGEASTWDRIMKLARGGA